MRIKLTISYHGAKFYGSQIQKDKKTVNGNIQAVLKELNIHEKVHGAGRTDKGVHATNQVLHLDLPSYWKDIEKLKFLMNYKLNNEIFIKYIEVVADTFHARYDAKSRVYRYILKDSINPFDYDLFTYEKNLDFSSIENNIKYFLGQYDFKYFTKDIQPNQSTTRIIYNTFAYKYKDKIILHFRANGFLKSQIRMMVGMLLAISTQKATTQDLINNLTCKEKFDIRPALPNGLYLSKIIY